MDTGFFATTVICHWVSTDIARIKRVVKQMDNLLLTDEEINAIKVPCDSNKKLYCNKPKGYDCVKCYIDSAIKLQLQKLKDRGDIYVKIESPCQCNWGDGDHIRADYTPLSDYKEELKW